PSPSWTSTPSLLQLKKNGSVPGGTATSKHGDLPGQAETGMTLHWAATGPAAKAKPRIVTRDAGIRSWVHLFEIEFAAIGPPAESCAELRSRPRGSLGRASAR